MTVTSNGSPYTVGPLSCPSVMLVYCGQTVGWIKMPLGTVVGLGPGDIVLDGDLAPHTERGTAAHPLFGPCLLWPNGWMDQNATWYGGRPRPRRHCVRSGPSFPHEWAQQPFPHFLPTLLWHGRLSQLLISSCLFFVKALFRWRQTKRTNSARLVFEQSKLACIVK